MNRFVTGTGLTVSRLFVAFAIGLLATSVCAQDAPLPASLPSIPAITDGMRLEGAALVAAMQKGGFVLYLRHGETGEVSNDCGKSNLTAKGREQARSIGEAMRALKLPIGKVISSDVCRALETAQLVNVGKVETHDDLHRMPKRPDHAFHEGRAKLIATPPGAGSNTLLVGHIHFGNGEDQRLFMQIAEMIVFKPKANGAPDVVARIRVEEWAGLVATAAGVGKTGREPEDKAKRP